MVLHFSRVSHSFNQSSMLIFALKHSHFTSNKSNLAKKLAEDKESWNEASPGGLLAVS